jgi:hypothetical protein
MENSLRVKDGGVEVGLHMDVESHDNEEEMEPVGIKNYESADESPEDEVSPASIKSEPLSDDDMQNTNYEKERSANSDKEADGPVHWMSPDDSEIPPGRGKLKIDVVDPLHGGSVKAKPVEEDCDYDIVSYKLPIFHYESYERSVEQNLVYLLKVKAKRPSPNSCNAKNAKSMFF